MTPGDVTARVLVDLPTSARRTARGFPVVPRAMREKSARALIRAIVVVDAMLAVVRACADGGAGANGRETVWR